MKIRLTFKIIKRKQRFITKVAPTNFRKNFFRHHYQSKISYWANQFSDLNMERTLRTINHCQILTEHFGGYCWESLISLHFISSFIIKRRRFKSIDRNTCCVQKTIKKNKIQFQSISQPIIMLDNDFSINFELDIKFNSFNRQLCLCVT
jgi:hypothetical protein